MVGLLCCRFPAPVAGGVYNNRFGTSGHGRASCLSLVLLRVKTDRCKNSDLLSQSRAQEKQYLLLVHK